MERLEMKDQSGKTGISEQENLKRIHSVLLDTASHTAEILEKHNIPYMLASGTLLGAVRHQDIIPWDDDFDFCLFDDTYDDALAYLREELPEDLFVQDEKTEPIYFNGWARVGNLKTETFPKQNPPYSFQGLSVDLFRTKKMRRSEVKQFVIDENQRYITRRRMTGTYSEEDCKKKAEELRRKRMAEKDFPGDNTEVYGFYTLESESDHYMMPESIFPLKRYTIHGVQFWGPNDAEALLTLWYGDFMQLPPVEERVGHVSTVVFYD